MTASTTETAPVVATPQYKICELTTYELRGYRHDLEKAIAFFDKQDPVPAARAALQARLDAVLAEQDERERMSHR